MNTYIPTALLQTLDKYCICDHQSSVPVPAISRGIKLIDKNEPLTEGFLYVGQPEDLKKVLSGFCCEIPPVCIVTAGACSFFDESRPVPDPVFLIQTSLELIPLYNRVHDCFHRTFSQNSKTSEDLSVNRAFQSLITDILDSKITDPEEINSYLEKFNLNPSRYFRLYGLRFNNSTYTGSIAWNYIISAMQQIFPSSYIATYNDSIVILDRHATLQNLNVNREAIMSLLKQYDGFLGIGNMCGHLASVPAVYSQLKAAIRFGIKLNPSDRIYFYEDYAMYQIIELALEAANRGMHTRNPIHLMNNEAVRLLEHDSKYNDNLLYVLDSYLMHNCNIKNTSEALFIHRNTLRNKIEKIESIMGTPLGDPILEERLRFSCTTYKYLKDILHADPLKLRRNSE